MVPLLFTLAFAAPADLPAGCERRLGTPDQRAPYYQLSWTGDGKQIFGGDPDHQNWRTWDASTGALTASGVVPEMFRSLNDARWKPGGRLFGWTRLGPAAQGGHPADMLFIEFDAVAGKVVRDWAVNRTDFKLGFTFSDTELSPDGRWIVGHENDMDIGGELHVLDRDKRKHESLIDIRSNAWSRPLFSFAPDSKAFVMFQDHTAIGSRCFEAESGKELWSVLNGTVKSNAFTRDGEWWAVTLPEDRKPAVVRYAAATGVKLEVPTALAVVDPHAVAVTPDDRLVIVSGAKETIVWDRKSKTSLSLPATTADLLPTADSKSVVTCNGLLQKWDLATGQPLFADAAAGHIDEVHTLVFSKDGSQLFSAATDGTVRCWDAATGKAIRTFALGTRGFPCFRNDPPQKGLYAFAIDEPAKRLATMGLDSPLVLWDLATGKELGRITLPGFNETYRYRAAWGVRCDGNTVTAIVLDFPHRNSSGTLHQLQWDVERGTHTYAPLPGRSIWAGEDGLAPDFRHWNEGRNSRLHRVADGTIVLDYRESGFRSKQYDAGGTRLAGTEVLKEAEKNDKRWRSGMVVLSIPDGKVLARFPLDDDLGRRRYAFDPRTAEHIAEANGSRIQLRDMSGRVLWKGDAGDRAGEPSAMAISPAGMLATGHRDGTILLWKLPEERK